MIQKKNSFSRRLTLLLPAFMIESVCAIAKGPIPAPTVKGKKGMGNLRKGDTLNNSRGFCWWRKRSLCMYNDLDRYFSCLQPRTDKREGVEGKGKERKRNTDNDNEQK